METSGIDKGGSWDLHRVLWVLWLLIPLRLLLLSCFSRIQLCVTPLTAAHQAPRSLGFSRQEHWSGLPLPSASNISSYLIFIWQGNICVNCVLITPVLTWDTKSPPTDSALLKNLLCLTVTPINQMIPHMTPASSLRAASSEICLSRCSSASFFKKLKTNILLKYSWFTRLYWLQVYSNVIWSYLYSWHLVFNSERAMAPHSSTLAWKIPWMEEPGGLQPMGLQRLGHDWAPSLSLFTFMHWRRKWQPTPVFLPGESKGRGSLAGCHLWGRTESDTTEVT